MFLLHTPRCVVAGAGGCRGGPTCRAAASAGHQSRGVIWLTLKQQHTLLQPNHCESAASTGCGFNQVPPARMPLLPKQHGSSHRRTCRSWSDLKPQVFFEAEV